MKIIKVGTLSYRPNDQNGRDIKISGWEFDGEYTGNYAPQDGIRTILDFIKEGISEENNVTFSGDCSGWETPPPIEFAPYSVSEWDLGKRLTIPPQVKTCSINGKTMDCIEAQEYLDKMHDKG